jgi:hypothetical protein
VLSSIEQRRAVRRSFDAVGAGDEPRYFDATLTRIRRAIACGEPLDPFDESHVAVAEHVNVQLAAEQAVDFDAMVESTLHVVCAEAFEAVRASQMNEAAAAWSRALAGVEPTADPDHVISWRTLGRPGRPVIGAVVTGYGE